MRRIYLKNIQKYAIVDGDDYLPMTLIHKWRGYKIGKTTYAVTHYKGKRFYMHRMILCPLYKGKLQVDHIDHNGLNNRKSNLRLVSQAENLRNGGVRTSNTSGFTGVSYYKSRNRWEAYIMINRKQKRIGYFNTKKDAIKARKAY